MVSIIMGASLISSCVCVFVCVSRHLCERNAPKLAFSCRLNPSRGTKAMLKN